MIKAKLFVLGTERELLWTDLEYSKTLNHKTGRCGEIPMGGLVTLAFSSGYDDDRLLRWMTHNLENKFCTLTECKIIFYEGDFDGVTLFEYKFNDAALIYWKEKFTAVGEKPMTITMTISAAIQEVKGITLVKPWQESWIPPSERIPYQSSEEEIKKIYYFEWHTKNGVKITQNQKLKAVDNNGNLEDYSFSDFRYGEQVKLYIKTINMAGQKIDVVIESNDGTFKKEFKQIEVLNNETTTIDPFHIPIKEYDQSIEIYNYTQHLTAVKKNTIKTFKVSINETTYSNPKELLIPHTYRRNYEELIGLFNTDNSGKKDKQTNYENKFINSTTDIKSIVDEFIEKVIAEDITISEIKPLVEEKATALWDAAVKQVQGGNFDDRPLYWARNKMQTWLKRSPLFKDQVDLETSIVCPDTELENIIKLFEEKSRNYTGIDFSKAGNKKKILITGFDPFLLNSFDHKYKRGFNILQSNPSGCVALNFQGKNIENSFIQTMIVPVRYSDFDNSQQNDKGEGKGIIEKYIHNYIDQVDTIITISQSLPGDYNIDKFATLRRGGFNDNLDYTREDNSKALNSNDEWIETTLPKEMTNAPYVEYNWEFDRVPNPKKIKPDKEQKLSQGSGGNYLSNEIFYRVARLRKEKKPILPTGHFHISKLQNENVREDFSNNKTKEMITIVRKGIIEGIKGLKK
ncbi:type VI secretion system tube protein TssD [Aquimarina muelleri]|uniref:Uncharacterized protein n=1 Tax=Aquimarina muelleri TaxID=279356 RepID=A0A918N302_9FLAO|nr:type VI secretion system tube protein TssD [Aquimarina muelleri]MCX2761765.1 type VI secretion system tube protein TssD [Aquimarina muelleri]GGX16018.1 hypothetical protein GCM10007384_16960 [Aquimarina muelleri]